MTELILQTQTLPPQLFPLIQTERVRVRQENGNVVLSPIQEQDSRCPFYGIARDMNYTVDDLMADKAREKELE